MSEFVPSELAADTPFGGGRFDSTTQDAYPYMYAAFSRGTALAEVLLRDIPFNEQGVRILPRVRVCGRLLSSAELASDLTLVALTTSAELAAVSQDGWLVQAEQDEYGKTRHWAHWLRQQAPWAQGFVWPSKRDVGEEAIILFGDRCRPGDLRPGLLPPVELDSYEGGMWLNDVLAQYHATVRLPAKKTADHAG